MLLLVAVVGVNGYGVARARIAGPRPDPAALAAWLEAEGETHGFSDYQGAYSTLFYSLERVVVSPTIIDAMNDRRPAYTEAVRASARPFFVLYSARYPDQIAVLEARLTELGVDYQRAEVGGMVVFRRLLRRVLPEEIGLLREFP